MKKTLQTSEILSLSFRKFLTQHKGKKKEMVFVFEGTKVNEHEALIYMGKDKFENESLLRICQHQRDIWFHVDKYSSAHVYLRLPPPSLDDKKIPQKEQKPQGKGKISIKSSNDLLASIPQIWIDECSQLAREGSREGSQHKDICVIYTVCENLAKTGDMDVGTVSFHNSQVVKRVIVRCRNNRQLDRISETKKEITLDEFVESFNERIESPLTSPGDKIDAVAKKADLYAEVFDNFDSQPNNQYDCTRTVQSIEEDFFS